MTDDKRHLFDEPRNVRRVIGSLFVVCAALLLVELFFHKHGHYAFEDWPVFHAVFGFVTFFLVVLIGKQLRRVLMRDEDYYDR